MDESIGFDASKLKLLIVDEVDRVLDLGFQDTMTQILSNLNSVNR